MSFLAPSTKRLWRIVPPPSLVPKAPKRCRRRQQRPRETGLIGHGQSDEVGLVNGALCGCLDGRNHEVGKRPTAPMDATPAQVC
jgi:hypothetical protein